MLLNLIPSSRDPALSFPNRYGLLLAIAVSSTILFLSSDAEIRRVITKTLESEGHVVLGASDVGDAVDWLKDCRPDLLMIRHYTETMSGHDAALHLRRICPGIPVLLVGGLLDDEALESREIVCGFEIFPKPFKATDLLNKVKDVLAKCSSRHTTAYDHEQRA